MTIDEFYKVIKIIIDNYVDANSGIFNTRNIADDQMEILYKTDNVTVEICRSFGYFEIFCDEEYFEKFKDFYYHLDKVTNGEEFSEIVSILSKVIRIKK